MTRGHDPEYSLVHAVGLCVLNWSRIEVLLVELFHTVIGRPSPDQDSMLDRIPSFATRLAVIDAAMHQCGMPEAILSRWSKVREAVLEKHQRRNAIVGAGVRTERIDPRSSRTISVRQLPVGALLKRDKSVHLSDLDAAANAFQRLAQDIADLHTDVQNVLIARMTLEARQAAGSSDAA